MVGICASILFALLVWPTIYRYDHMDLGQGVSYPVRTNRVTGRAEVLYQDGWYAPKKSTAPAAEQDLPQEQLVHLHGKATVTPTGHLHLNVYNGSRFIVREVQIEFSLRNSENYELWDRSYRLISGFGSVEPEATSEFGASLGSPVEKDELWDCKIVGAKGTLTDRIPVDNTPIHNLDSLNYVVADPDFWALKQPVQQAVIARMDWGFARRKPEEQRTWLQEKHKEFLLHKIKTEDRQSQPPTE